MNSKSNEFQKTRDRMISYWSYYYRHRYPNIKDYVGFKMFAYFDQLSQTIQQ